MDNNVLIIDDDEELCAELLEILNDEGFQVSVASSGAQGQGLIKDHQYGLIILDLKLGETSGIDVLKMIRRQNHQQKVLVFSGKPLGKELKALPDAERESTDVVMKLADAVLNKPVQIDILLKKVKELAAV